jgi:hypothetical protein
MPTDPVASIAPVADEPHGRPPSAHGLTSPQHSATSPSPGADVAAGRAQCWRRCGQGRARSRCRCGRGRAQCWRRCGQGRARSRCRCGTGLARSWRRCGQGRAQSRRRCGTGRAQSRRRCGQGRAQSRRRCGGSQEERIRLMRELEAQRAYRKALDLEYSSLPPSAQGGPRAAHAPPERASSGTRAACHVQTYSAALRCARRPATGSVLCRVGVERANAPAAGLTPPTSAAGLGVPRATSAPGPGVPRVTSAPESQRC